MPLDLLRYPFCSSRNIRGLFVKSLPLFVLLIFSPSSVGKLWVCSCLGRFLCLGPFGSMWSFLWSSIRVRVLLLGICLFLVLVCREWRWNSWTRIRLFHHGLAFFNSIYFSVVLSESKCIFTFGSSSSPSNSFVTLRSVYSRLFCYVLLVAISLFKIVRFLLHPVVGMFSCHLPPFIGRISFRCFGMSCFVCIVLLFFFF